MMMMAMMIVMVIVQVKGSPVLHKLSMLSCLPPFGFKVFCPCARSLVHYVSALEVAKREVVTLLRTLALKYRVQLDLTRESADKAVEAAFRRVALKVHPDKGGDQAEFQRLSVYSTNLLSVAAVCPQPCTR